MVWPSAMVAGTPSTNTRTPRMPNWVRAPEAADGEPVADCKVVAILDLDSRQGGHDFAQRQAWLGPGDQRVAADRDRIRQCSHWRSRTGHRDDDRFQLDGSRISNLSVSVTGGCPGRNQTQRQSR